MANILGKAYVYVQFDGGPPIILPPEAIAFLWITAHASLVGPAFTMRLYDSTGLLGNPTPGDGSIVTINVGTTPENLTEYTFVLSGAPVSGQDGHGPFLDFQGLLNAPRLFLEVGNFASRGSSSQVISEIGLKLNLAVKVDNSQDDSMVWYGGQNRWGAILASIASRGWFGADSAASVVAIDAQYLLQYRDLAKLARQKPKHSLYFRKPLPEAGSDAAAFAYAVVSMKRDDRTSLTTMQQGYSAVSKHFDANGDLQAYDKVNVTRQNNSLNMSESVRTNTGFGRQTLMPSTGPNTHPHYEQALGQNLRYRASYSSKISALIKDVTLDLTLLTPVTIYATNISSGNADDALLAVNGLVESKTIGVYNGNYLEKLVIAHQGVDSGVVTTPQQ